MPLWNISKNKYYQIKFKAIHYRGNIVMHPIGSDFDWESAHVYFKNLDRLLNYINNRKEEYNMEIMYSTPSIYLKVS